METFDPVGGGFIVERIADFFTGAGSQSLGTIGSIVAFFKVIFIFFFILFLIGIFYVIYQTTFYRPKFELVLEPGKVPHQKFARKRWDEIMQRFALGSESDFRLAVVEADSLVEEVFKKIGFDGETLGDRIQAISEHELHSISGLKEAHGLRNRLVHTPGFKVSRSEAELALSRYEDVLEELEVI